MMLRLVAIVIVLTCMNGFTAAQDKQYVEEFTQYTFYLSEVMLHDVVNPPAASRFYAYAMLGAYEAIYAADNLQVDIAKSFRINPGFRFNVLPAHYSRSFCAIYAMLDVGRQMIPSGYSLEERELELVKLYGKKHKLSGTDIEENIAFAKNVADQVTAFAKTDGYLKLSTWQRYNPNTREEGHWYPTPPEYMSAVEPQWKTIRPFFLDSASQFPPRPPVPFDKEKESGFYKLMQEVHVTSNTLTNEQRSIAAFWDCNPFAVTYSGHMAMGIKKISPGGHWIGITGIACRKAKAPLDKTVFAHVLVALTLCDGFISCWNEKYTSDRIRPEAAINKHLDPSWRPLLQTPPFPEYTSGHSVISTASAEVLTHLFGDSFGFTDTSEEYFGLPARTFVSFREAANEAAISRLYGGIHFRDAIEAGQEQGRAIGKYIINSLESGITKGQ
jgi:hypothetical protein